MDTQLGDEITSINAIYDPDTLTQISTSPDLCSLCLPGSHQISLRLEFPPDYPDAPPSILGTQSVGDDGVLKGQGQHIVELSRTVLAELYQPGAPVIFDLVEELQSRLQHLFSDAAKGARGEEAQSASGDDGAPQHESEDHHALESDERQQSSSMLDKDPPWTLSEVVTEKKSIFVARAAHVSSTDQAKSYLHHLLSMDKKVAKATHNITAWRIRGPNETAYQDCDDDGETAAGGRLLHLLQLMDVWDVMVVVSRWYGGVQLGPDRFRIINSVARDAVLRGGFDRVASKAGKGDSHAKKGSKR